MTTRRAEYWNGEEWASLTIQQKDGETWVDLSEIPESILAMLATHRNPSWTPFTGMVSRHNDLTRQINEAQEEIDRARGR